MESFDKNWTCAEAIQALFFADEVACSVNSKKMIEIIKMAFGGLPLKASNLNEQQKNTVEKAVLAIKSTMENLKVTDQLHPILWVRWALHSSGLPVANEFILQLACWRAKWKPSYIVLLQHWDPETKTWRGKNGASNGIEKLVGFTFDQIVAREKFSFKEYEVKWKIKKVRFTAVGKKKSPPRPIARVCGRNVLDSLHESIHTEAKDCKLGVLSVEQTDGKYECSISPAEMIRRLKLHYPDMKRFSDSTLIRGLPSIVRCPKGRPGGIQQKTA